MGGRQSDRNTRRVIPDINYRKQKEMANQPNNPQQPQKPKRSRLSWLYYVVMLTLLVLLFYPFGGRGVQKDLSYTKFRAYIENDAVASLVVSDDNTAKAKIRPESYALVFGNREEGEDVRGELTALIPSVEEFSKFMDQVNDNRQAQGKAAIDVSYTKSHDYWYLILVNVLPLLLIVMFFVWMSRGIGGGAGGAANIFGVGKAKAQVIDKDKKDKVTFKDVAGLAGAKQEVEEVVSFLKDPKKYTDLGGKIPKGVLLVGPPGTGKTLLAKAVAGEANVPFFSMSGSDFVEMFVGVGASRVRDLFKTAKEKAPCIIFIDEIDAIGRARGKNLASGSNDERENTLNQLLTEMDGFGTNAGVIILAATNRADILDKALLRAGRFDRQIHVELPDVEERKAIFKVHTKNLKYDSKEVDIDFLAKQTPGFSGADIANLCNEAALIAARNDKKIIGKQDFLDAVDRIIGGLEKKTKIIKPKEKRTIAYHEAGHASVSWLLEHANPLVKVTIVPRGSALGAAWYLPEERQITTTAQLMDQMVSLLGGRAAEELVFGEVSTGALNDLERVTKQAYAMVVYYGLDKEIGNLSFYDSTGQSEYGFQKPFSEKTAEKIDDRIHGMVEAAYAKAKSILSENREKLDALAAILIDREVIFREDVEKIYGKRPWNDETEQAEEKSSTKDTKAEE